MTKDEKKKVIFKDIENNYPEFLRQAKSKLSRYNFRNREHEDLVSEVTFSVMTKLDSTRDGTFYINKFYIDVLDNRLRLYIFKAINTQATKVKGNTWIARQLDQKNRLVYLEDFGETNYNAGIKFDQNKHWYISEKTIEDFKETQNESEETLQFIDTMMNKIEKLMGICIVVEEGKPKVVDLERSSSELRRIFGKQWAYYVKIVKIYLIEKLLDSKTKYVDIEKKYHLRNISSHYRRVWHKLQIELNKNQ